MLEACIFDLDGVIVYTVPLHFKAWKAMFNEYGKDFTFEDYKQKVDGIPRLDGTRAILTDLNDEDIKKAAEKKQGYYLKLLDEAEVPIFQSSIDLVKQIKAANLKLAVVSSSKNCPYILKKIGLTDIIDVIISGNELSKGKPDPQIFLLAAEKLNVDHSKCVVFEDAVLGVEAAKNAKMFCIGVARHDGDEEKLNKSDYIIKDLEEVTLDKIKDFMES